MSLFQKNTLQDINKDDTLLYLKERYRTSEITAYDGVPTVYYDVLCQKEDIKVGTIELRLKNDGDNYYYGNIGYNILKEYRGHHYAYEATKLLFQVAKKEFLMKELIITCSPENIASYKTLVKLKGNLKEIVEVPEDHELYRRNEKKKCIFYYTL